LQCGGVDLVLGRGRLEIEQRLDVAAHALLLSPAAWIHHLSQGRSAHGKSYIIAYSVMKALVSSPLPAATVKRVPDEPCDLQDRRT
jgi:hypothetical protein